MYQKHQNGAYHNTDNTKLPESMKQACCNICTLAEKMKDCKNCPFNHYKPAVK